MKLELLREYMLVAPDPTLRSGSKTGKARHSSNIKVMLKEGVGIRLPGEQEKTLLSSIVKGEDTLAQFMQGVWGQRLHWSEGEANWHRWISSLH